MLIILTCLEAINFCFIFCQLFFVSACLKFFFPIWVLMKVVAFGDKPLQLLYCCFFRCRIQNIFGGLCLMKLLVQLLLFWSVLCTFLIYLSFLLLPFFVQISKTVFCCAIYSVFRVFIPYIAFIQQHHYYELVAPDTLIVNITCHNNSSH